MLALAVRNRRPAARTSLQPVLAAMIISMCIAPLVIQFAEPIVRKLTANDWLARAAQVTQIAARSMARQDHIIICGYGRSGQNLARLLEAEDIAVRRDGLRSAARARGRGRRQQRGRTATRAGARRSSSAGLAKARAVAITFANTAIALKILHHVQQLRPDLPVIVRTVDDSRDRQAASRPARPRSCRKCSKAASCSRRTRCSCWACRSTAC